MRMEMRLICFLVIGNWKIVIVIGNLELAMGNKATCNRQLVIKR